MSCSHIQSITPDKVIQKSNFVRFECEECVKINSRWVHLRICQTCGKMLCCESSPNQHMKRHFEETGHPVMSSAELGENWMYCYLDDVTVGDYD